MPLNYMSQIESTPSGIPAHKFTTAISYLKNIQTYWVYGHTGQIVKNTQKIVLLSNKFCINNH